MVDQPETTSQSTQPANPFAVAATLPQSTTDQAKEEVKEAPVWLGDLIRDGFYDKVVLIGFPYDEGARKAGNRKGADFAPDSFRRFVKDVGSVKNPEYGVDIAAGIPHIADYGNIQIEGTLDQKFDDQGQVISQKLTKASQGELYAKLATKTGLCLQRRFIPFVIGGSRDLFQAIVDAHLAHSKNFELEHKTTFLSINHSLDVSPLLNDDMSHQTSCKRYLLERLPANYSVWAFGLEGRRVAQQDLTYFESKIDESRRSVTWLSQIKRQGAVTLWNAMLDKLISQQEQDAVNDGVENLVHLSINLESIEGLKGVSTNCLSGGIPTEDAVEMVYQAGLRLGKADLLKSVDLAEYNPHVEDQQTGRFAATLFYYLVLGLSQGIQERAKECEP